MNLPSFKYHPQPLKTGAISKSEKECVCCGQKRGYIYTGSVYGEIDFEEQLCPWCIHSGLAAEKYDLCFTNYHSLIKAGLSEEIIENVSKRTPGYICWQSEHWLSHCNDACAFLGDAEKILLSNLIWIR